MSLGSGALDLLGLRGTPPERLWKNKKLHESFLRSCESGTGVLVLAAAQPRIRELRQEHPRVWVADVRTMLYAVGPVPAVLRAYEARARGECRSKKAMGLALPILGDLAHERTAEPPHALASHEELERTRQELRDAADELKRVRQERDKKSRSRCFPHVQGRRPPEAD